MKHELTKQQIDNIKRGVDYGKMNKVEVKFIIEKIGGRMKKNNF